VDAAVEAGADMLGFIFYEPSHRYIQPQQVQAVLQASERFAAPSKGQATPDIVGVFVNKDADFINDVVEQVGLHFVQLHGTELPELCQKIKRPVIKALHLRGEDDLRQVQAYKDITWRLLLDTPTPAWGGTGATHDWELACTAAQETPILLAGGLTLENVAEALQQVHPWGVDVSSGVETNKQKDVGKIRAFVEEVRKKEQPTNANAKHRNFP
jgi:phosphoribosylanthranilate isomerase